MNELLRRLEAWLREYRPDYLAQLLPGLTDAEYARFAEQFGVTPPHSFRALYQWRNGQPPRSSASLQHNMQFASAASVLESKDVLDELQEGGEFEDANWWSPAWLPFLNNGMGDHLCVDMAGSFTGHVGQVLNFWHDDNPRRIDHPDLETWLECFVSSLERDEWEVQSGDIQPRDYDVWTEYLSQRVSGYPIQAEAG